MTVSVENRARPLTRPVRRPQGLRASMPWAAPPAAEHARVLPWQACAKCGIYLFPGERACGSCAGGWGTW